MDLTSKIKSLSVVLPAYNEAENIVPLLTDISAFLEEQHADYEIVVVNDGSKDDTGTLAEGFAILHPRVRVVHHPRNRGYGGALISGFADATKDWVFLMDSDRQFDIHELTKLAEKTDQADFILGYRAKRSDHAIRLLNAKLFNLAIRILFGLHVRDIDCAFKLMRRSILQSLELESNGAFISSELLIKAKRRGARMAEVPVSHFERQYGNPTGANFRVILRAIKEVLLFRFTGRVSKPR